MLSQPFDNYAAHFEREARTRSKDMRSRELEPVTRLRRDDLWQLHSARSQLEFIVDNETVAKLMNLQSQIENPFYEPMVARIRQSIFDVYGKHFHYKAVTSVVMIGSLANLTNKRMLSTTGYWTKIRKLMN